MLYIICEQLGVEAQQQSADGGEPLTEDAVLGKIDSLLGLFGLGAVVSVRALWRDAERELGGDQRARLWTAVTVLLRAAAHHCALLPP